MTEDFTENEEESIVKYMESTDWRRALDKKRGKWYYYNIVDKSVQWQAPGDIAAFINSLKNCRQKGSEPSPLESVPSSDGDNQNNSLHVTTGKPSDEETVLQAPVSNPDEESRDDMEMYLMQADSILQPEVIDKARSLIRVYQETPQRIVTQLVTNYTGYPSLTGILLEWLKLAESMVDGKTAVPTVLTSSKTDIIAVSAELAGKQFNKNKADEASTLFYPKCPPWLHDIISHEEYRKLMVNMRKSSSDSQFLAVCMNEIRSLGYTASDDVTDMLIDKSDFGAFSNLLGTLLSKVSDNWMLFNSFMSLYCM
jgi:hypothetical protein